MTQFRDAQELVGPHEFRPHRFPLSKRRCRHCYLLPREHPTGWVRARPNQRRHV